MASSTGKQQLLKLKEAAAMSPTLNGSSPRADMVSCLRHPMSVNSIIALKRSGS